MAAMEGGGARIKDHGNQSSLSPSLLTPPPLLSLSFPSLPLLLSFSVRNYRACAVSQSLAAPKKPACLRVIALDPPRGEDCAKYHQSYSQVADHCQIH